MIINKKEFCSFIEDKFAVEGSSIIYCVLDACEEFSIDPELVQPLINRQIKEKLEIEFVSMNYLEKRNVSVFQ